jgi:hypothetical protein
VTEKKQILRSIEQTVTCDISDNSEHVQEQESKQFWSDFQSKLSRNISFFTIAIVSVVSLHIMVLKIKVTI